MTFNAASRLRSLEDRSAALGSRRCELPGMHSVPKSAVLPYASGVGGLSRRLFIKCISIYICLNMCVHTYIYIHIYIYVRVLFSLVLWTLRVQPQGRNLRLQDAPEVALAEGSVRRRALLSTEGRKGSLEYSPPSC